MSGTQTVLLEAMKLGLQQGLGPEYGEEGDHRKPISPTDEQSQRNLYVTIFHIIFVRIM